MAAKRLFTSGPAASTLYMIVRRLSDDFILNDFDGAFDVAPADPYVAMTEVPVVGGLYEKSESREVWADGMYQVIFYNQVGAAPSPAADAPPLTASEILVVGDAVLSQLMEVSDTRYLVANAIQNRRDLGAVLSALANIQDRLRSIESVMGSLTKSMERA